MTDLKYLATHRLRAGPGDGTPEGGLCVMETVALLAGEKIDHRPKCACPVLTRFATGLNDNIDDERRQGLLRLAVMMAGTRAPEHEDTRSQILIDSCLQRKSLLWQGDGQMYLSTARHHRNWGRFSTALSCCLVELSQAFEDSRNRKPQLDQLWADTLAALRKAIEAGPHSALVIPEAQARYDAVAPRLPVDA